MSSASESEVGAPFLNIKEGKLLCLALIELGHTQLQTLLHCDNNSVSRIANNRMKNQRPHSMEMQLFWVNDQVKRGDFYVQWHPGNANLADYFTQRFDINHHQDA